MSTYQKELWLVVKASYGTAVYNKGKVTSVNVDRLVKTKPPTASLKRGEVAIKVTLNVDENMFLPVEPEITINLEADDIPETGVDVEVAGTRTRSSAAKKLRSP